MQHVMTAFDPTRDNLAAPTLHTLTAIYTSGLARDKVWKFVQNFSRFLFYILTLPSTSSSTSSVHLLSEWSKNLWKNISTARKGFRLGKSIVHANKLHQTLLNHKRTPLYKCIVSVKRSVLFAHELFDNCVWLSSSRLIAATHKESCKQWAYTTKFIGEVCGLYLQYVEWCRVRRLESGGSSRGKGGARDRDRDRDGNLAVVVDRKTIEKQRAKIIRTASKGFAQVVAAFINAKYATRMFGWPKNDGVIALCGMVNAVISVYDYWPQNKGNNKLK